MIPNPYDCTDMNLQPVGLALLTSLTDCKHCETANLTQSKDLKKKISIKLINRL